MTEEYKLQNGEGGCFACINSGQGFRSYFDTFLGKMQYVYVIKGGPGTGKSGMHDIVNAVKNGTLEESVLDQRLDELLRVIFATHQATVDGKGTTFNKEAHHKLARKRPRRASSF